MNCKKCGRAMVLLLDWGCDHCLGRSIVKLEAPVKTRQGLYLYARQRNDTTALAHIMTCWMESLEMAAKMLGRAQTAMNPIRCFNVGVGPGAEFYKQEDTPYYGKLESMKLDHHHNFLVLRVNPKLPIIDMTHSYDRSAPPIELEIYREIEVPA